MVIMQRKCTSPVSTEFSHSGFQQVLSMTTHSLQVGQSVHPVVAPRLLPLSDRGGSSSVQQGLYARLALCFCIYVRNKTTAVDVAYCCSYSHSPCWRLLARQRPRGGVPQAHPPSLLCPSLFIIVETLFDYHSAVSGRYCVCCLPLQPS
jgi:hypothetical protein